MVRDASDRVTSSAITSLAMKLGYQLIDVRALHPRHSLMLEEIRDTLAQIVASATVQQEQAWDEEMDAEDWFQRQCDEEASK